MSRIPRQAKRDANEKAICEALEVQGFVVLKHSGPGEPDLVVFQRKTGKAWLVEVKQPKGTFTVAQQRWRSTWAGPVPITLRSVSDAERFMLLACEGGNAKQ